MTGTLTFDGTIAYIRSCGVGQPSRVRRELERLVEVAGAPKNTGFFTGANLEGFLRQFYALAENMVVFGREAEGLFADLAATGMVVDSIDELRMGRGSRDAVPILLKWFRTTDYLPLKIDILAAFDQPWAVPDAILPLFEEFHGIDPATDPDPNSLRWFVMNPLWMHARFEWLDRYLEIAVDPRNGDSRILAIQALGKLRKGRERVIPQMLKFVASDDPSLYLPAAGVLGKWHVAEAAARIKELLDTVESRNEGRFDGVPYVQWERTELRKALRAIPAGVTN